MNHDKNNTKVCVGLDGDVETLMHLLASPAGMTRLHAREALVAAGDSAVDPLIEALDDDHDVVRWEAAKALASIPCPRAAPALVAALEDDEFDVRWLAAEALIALQDAALPALLEALEKRADSVRLREGAHHILRNIRDVAIDGVVGPVLTALGHYEPELVVPLAAKDALATLRRKAPRTGRRIARPR